MQTETINLDLLLPHPQNPNQMSKAKLKKLTAHIRRTGLYEPLTVRPHPDIPDSFQLINGHHRAKALKALGHIEALCTIWPASDQDVEIYLTTLNRLAGTDNPAARQALISSLSKTFSPKDLATLLPETKPQIEKLISMTNSSLSLPDPKTITPTDLTPEVFFLTPTQHQILISALTRAAKKNPTGQAKSAALTQICNHFLESCS